MGLQAFGNLPQRSGLRQLPKQHGYQLGPTAEIACVPLRLVLRDGCRKAFVRDKRKIWPKMLPTRFMVKSPRFLEWFLAELNPKLLKISPLNLFR